MVRKQMKKDVDGKYILYNIKGEFGEQEGEGIFDVFKNVGTKIAAKLTGKAAKEIATKAATKAFEKGAEKVGEKTGQLIGEKIYNKFSERPAPLEGLAPRAPPRAPQLDKPQVPSERSGVRAPQLDIGTQLMKDLQKDKSWLPLERQAPRRGSPEAHRASPKKEKALIDVFDELFLQ